MLRIAVLQVSALLGGSDRSLLEMLKAGHNKLFSAIVLLPQEGPLCRNLCAIGVQWVVVKQSDALLRVSRSFRVESLPDLFALPIGIPGYLFRLNRAIRRLSPDIIYTNGIKAQILSAMLRPILHLPIVWHLREQWGGPVVGCMADYGADLIIANSRSTGTALQKYMKNPGKVIVIHNAVDVDEFSPNGPVADIGSVKGQTAKIGLPGALARLKGHELLLNAAHRIRTEFPFTKFFFIGGEIYDTLGDQGYEKELRQLVERESLGECVNFTGFQEEMAPWYRAMDIVVNTSIRPEGFGRTLLEAMACGRAVIGPNAGGIPEFVEHGKNGLLYEMGDSGALADAVLTLLRNPDIRGRLGVAGRETALRWFGVGPYAEAISQALHNVANKRIDSLH